MNGCNKRSPESSSVQSTSRVVFFAASSLDATTGFMSSMNTSHRSYCQNAYTPVVEALKSYASMAAFTAATALSSRESAHRDAGVRPGVRLSSATSGGAYPSPRFIIANRTAFHILLHQWR